MGTEAIVNVSRLIHVNYNCTDVERVSEFYVSTFDLKQVMRSVSNDMPGTPFGLYAPTANDTTFLYDHRGPRRAGSFEIAQWLNPPTFGLPYPDPWHLGIQAIGFSAPDLDAIATSAIAQGAEGVARHRDALALRDPEGLPVEVYRSTDVAPQQRHVRIVVEDIDATVAWWSKLGFTLSNDTFQTPPGGLWEGDADHSVGQEVAMVASDEKSFALIFQTWNGPPSPGPTYAAPFHQGLYRLAFAVEDAHEAWRALASNGYAVEPPYTFAIPDTKLVGGLTILLMREPHGILVELMERPASKFVRD